MNLDNIFYRVKIYNPDNKIVDDFDCGTFSNSMSMVCYYVEQLGYDFLQVEISHVINGNSNFRVYKFL